MTTTGSHQLVDQHERLAAVRQMIVDGSMSVLSFDIFDTVLWRRVPVPTDLFAVVAARLRDDGLSASWMTDHDFRRLREVAEHEARRKQGALGPEVSLHDIWAAMPRAPFSAGTVEELVAVEVEVERAFTVVDLGVAELVRLAGKHGTPVVFVSDTYFTADHLRRLLDRPELGPLTDIRIFRSNAHGTDKGSELWPVVLRALGCRPEEIVHIGDNPIADDEAPAEHGIRTVFYERIDDAFGEVLARERPSAATYTPFGRSIDTRDGDFGLTTLRARTVSGVGADETRVATAWRWGAGVLGPVLTGFAEFVAHNASERGVQTVWCPMREGELLSDLVNEAARARGLSVEAKPIWLSRQVVWLATIDKLDVKSLRDVMRRSYGATVRSILTAFELRVGEVPALAPHLDRVLEDVDLLNEVAVALTETPYLRHRLATMATAKRERLVRALRRHGALDEPEIVLVDLGWGGTIQLQLAQALELAQVEVAPSGLYLATDRRAVRLLEEGLRIEGFLGSTGHPGAVVSTIARSPEVIEMSVNALCGSLVDFTDDGEPILGPVISTVGQDSERRAVQDGVRRFQDRWNAYVRHADGSWPSLTLGPARARLAEILRAALDGPTAAEASLFGPWVHEDNLGSDLTSRIFPDDLLRAVPYMSVGDVADLGMRDAFWPGLVAAAEPRLGAAFRAVRSGDVAPDVFEPSPDLTSASLLMYRTADDEWHEGPTHRVRVNQNGLSFARFSLRAIELVERKREDVEDDAFDVDRSDRNTREIVDVSVALPGRPALVRVDWIEARLTSATDGSTVVVEWNTPGELAGLHLADAAWLGGNLVEFRSERAAFVLPVAARAGAPLASVQVSVAFAVLPQSVSGLTPPAPPAKGRARIAGRLLEEYKSGGAAGVAAGAVRLALRQVVER